MAQPPPIAPFSHGSIPQASVRLGKSRGPFVVWLLSVITCGIYSLFWYYMINRELRDYNGQIPVSPGIATLNISLFGALTCSVTAIVSCIFTGARIRKAMGFARVGSCSGLVALLLTVFVFGTGICYYQSKLNRIWAAHGQAR